jgi:tetratricopeptide (TPR) repeat protein
VNQLNAVVFGAGPVADRVAAALKAAVIHEAHLDNVTTAVSLLRRAADIDPKSVAVLDELVRMSYRIEDWGGMVNVLRRKAALVPGLDEKVALLAQACETALSQLGDLSLAGAVAQEIISLDASNPKALLVMAHLMESRSQTEDALGLFRRLVQAAGERDERVEALLGVARILLSRGEKGDEVRRCLQDAVREKPDHPEVNRHLKRLYLEGGEHQAVIEVVMRELKQATGDAEKATLCMDIAEIYQRHLNDGASFLKWAEEAHGHKRDDPRVVAGIVNHHLNSGEPRRAVPFLEWLVNYLEGKRRLKELPPYAHELGRILEGMGETDKAIQYYRMCHEHDAGNLPNALALGRLYMVRDEQEKALRVLQPLILRIDSLAGPARIEVLLALANINLAKGDKRKARQYVLRVLSEEPDNVDAQALLAKGL